MIRITRHSAHCYTVEYGYIHRTFATLASAESHAEIVAITSNGTVERIGY